ncbi:MAG: hypothetical protein H6701_15920 [Myxococcales bacterium]|nr:hypothetical protein [Myxococcales bacterium]
MEALAAKNPAMRDAVMLKMQGFEAERDKLVAAGGESAPTELARLNSRIEEYVRKLDPSMAPQKTTTSTTGKLNQPATNAPPGAPGTGTAPGAAPGAVPGGKLGGTAPGAMGAPGQPGAPGAMGAPVSGTSAAARRGHGSAAGTLGGTAPGGMAAPGRARSAAARRVAPHRVAWARPALRRRRVASSVSDRGPVNPSMA